MTLNERQEAMLLTRGHIHWIDQKSNVVYKVYKKGNLLDDPDNIKTRLSQIVKLSGAMEFMPEINYSYEEDLLVMRQNRLAKDNQLKKIEPFEKKISLVRQFAQSLDKLHSTGFIHGDINRKNILYSSDRLCLIDLEPSLLQIKDKTRQWMSTRPYRHYEDIKNNTVSVKSDYLGFSCFVKWFLMGSNPPQDYADECSRIINEYEVEFLPFENFLEILLKRNSRESRPLTNLQHKKEDARIKKHIDFLVKSDNW
tara:strand:- start:69 stop:830 length:762 start_codon:yes stop_codon:yes gene_type:complete